MCNCLSYIRAYTPPLKRVKCWARRNPCHSSICNVHLDYMMLKCWDFYHHQDVVDVLVSLIVPEARIAQHTNTSSAHTHKTAYRQHIAVYTRRTITQDIEREKRLGREMGGTNSITALEPYLNGLWLAVVSRCSIGPGSSKWATVISFSFSLSLESSSSFLYSLPYLFSSSSLSLLFYRI